LEGRPVRDRLFVRHRPKRADGGTRKFQNLQITKLQIADCSDMARGKKISLRCPTCRKIVLRDEPQFPFCSERCRTIDLGKWASGGYVISTPINDPDDLDAIAYSGEKPPAKDDQNNSGDVSGHSRSHQEREGQK
jgi:endogenous inhibitor of DNA gyrase (YacG/DUF329 family)